MPERAFFKLLVKEGHEQESATTALTLEKLD